eukprot:SAG11_NODE_8052_length_1065_cov_0.985507_1_plen_73_part_00
MHSTVHVRTPEYSCNLINGMTRRGASGFGYALVVLNLVRPYMAMGMSLAMGTARHGRTKFNRKNRQDLVVPR